MNLPAEKEAPILAGVLDLLELLGIPAFRSNAGGGYRIGKGGRPQLIRGLPKGFPDVFGWLPNNGRILAVECKRPGEEPTPEQWAYLHAINRDGGFAFWTSDLERCRFVLTLALKGYDVSYQDDDNPGECVLIGTERGVSG
jgi:hypothetical protein